MLLSIRHVSVISFFVLKKKEIFGNFGKKLVLIGIISKKYEIRVKCSS